MEKVHKGIVIHSFLPYKYKYVVFDKFLGKIDGTCAAKYYQNRIRHGFLIEYTPIAQVRAPYFLETLDFLQLPDEWVNQDLSFLHHALELVYQLVPYDQPCQNIYNLLCLFYCP